MRKSSSASPFTRARLRWPCATSNPVAEYQQAGAVTDPQTGMTFGYLRFTDTRANKVFVTLECLYGFALGKADALKRIVKP